MASCIASPSKITSYFNHSPSKILKEDVINIKEETEIDTKCSFLITPDSTPTKNSPIKEEPETLNTRTPRKGMNRSNSDSILDSPRPTASKVSKQIENVEIKDDVVDYISSKPPQGGKKKGGQGRRKKVKSSVNNKKSTERSKSVPATKKKENHKLTDYFPVRRSCRVPSSELKKNAQKTLEESILARECSGLKVQDIEGKGRGVMASKIFKKADFVVEYEGKLIDLSTAKDLEEKYSKNQNIGCYMYYFNFNNKRYCIDATAESGRLGRLLNHSRTKPNCQTKVVGINGVPYLILVALRDIDIGEELLYDYGDRSKESLEAHPWLAY